MPMAIDAKLLTLTQWMSPAFPTGAFAFSHGLEAAIHDGWIADAQGLEEWLRDCLTDGTGRSDAIFLRLAFAAPDPRELDAQARAFATACERVREADRQGAAFVRTANAVWDLALPDLLLPIALGHAARRVGLDVEATVGLYLQAMVTNLVSAALRLSPLGQTAGQRVVLNLQDTCMSVANETRGATLDDLVGNAFLSDIAAMRHETQQPRLFQS
ncbi:urease accessory protein UreF [Palleronia pontilimi]